MGVHVRDAVRTRISRALFEDWYLFYLYLTFFLPLFRRRGEYQSLESSRVKHAETSSQFTIKSESDSDT